jgi:anti-sigma factor RsiW
MHTCDEIRVELKALADGELTQNQRSAVERHVDGCADCRRDLAEITRISSQLKALDTAMPRPELRSRILAQLAPDAEPARDRPKAPFWRMWIPGLAFASTAAAATIIGLMIYNRPINSPAPAHEEVALRTPDRNSSAGSTEPSKAAKSPAIALKSGPRVALNDGLERSLDTESRGKTQPAKDNPASKSKSTSLPPFQPGRNIGKAGVSSAAADRKEPLSRSNSENLPMVAAQSPIVAPIRGDEKSRRALMLKSPSSSINLGERDNYHMATAPSGQPKAAEPQGSQLSLGLGRGVAQQPPTNDIMVDHLETGVNRVLAVTKAEGGSAVQSQAKDGAAVEALLWVTIPSQNLESYKNQLVNKDANVVRYNFGDLLNDKTALGGLGAQAEQNVHMRGKLDSNFASNGVSGGKGGQGGGGGYGGGNIAGRQQVSGALGPAQQNLKQQQSGKNFGVDNSMVRAKPSNRQEVETKRVQDYRDQGQARNDALAKKESTRNELRADNKAGGEVQEGLAAGRRGGANEAEKPTLNDRNYLFYQKGDAVEPGMTRLLVRLREAPKPAAFKKARNLKQ